MSVKLNRFRIEPIADQQQASQYARSLVEASLDPLVTIGSERLSSAKHHG